MKMKTTLVLAIWLGLVLAVASRDVRNLNALEVQDEEERMMEERELEKSKPEEKEREEDELEERDLEENDPEERGLVVSQPEERDVGPGQKLKAYIKDKNSEVGALGQSVFGAGAALIKIDYSQSAGDIAWKVADAIMPVIGAALAFIPVVGPIVSGIFLGVWSIISAIWGPKEENPMEKMINEMADKLRKEMDEKLSTIIKLAIYGEIARNSYICNKYNYISNTFSENFNKSIALQPHDSLNIKIYLNDCDNFLKDTAEAFAYDDYADVLWVPGAITTSVRLGFLAELIKNGRLMGLTDNVLLMYVQELKNDTLRQFDYFGKGFKRQYKDLLADRKKKNIKGGEYKSNVNYLADVSAVETAACVLQGQYFYFDREMYPLGQPKNITTDNFFVIHMEDHYRRKNSHLQIFFNVSSRMYPSRLPRRNEKDPYLKLEFYNCFLGPMHLTAPSTLWFSFFPIYETNKYSYEFRIMYLDAGANAVPLLSEWTPSDNEIRAAPTGLIDTSKTSLQVEFVFDNNPRFKDSIKLVDIPANPHWKECPYVNTNMTFCKDYTKWLPSRFKMYSAGTFHHKEDISQLIPIHEPRSRAGGVKGFLVGMEIIIHSIMV